MDKPFVFGVAASGENFTDRKKETQRLLLNFTHGINTILISPRRWGKTSLVKKVATLADTGNRRVVYLDIFSCRTEQDFYKMFATAILKQTSSRLDEWIENTKLFLTRISPKITMGTDPINDFSISFELNPKDDSETDILKLPEKIPVNDRNQRLDFLYKRAFQRYGQTHIRRISTEGVYHRR